MDRQTNGLSSFVQGLEDVECKDTEPVSSISVTYKPLVSEGVQLNHWDQVSSYLFCVYLNHQYFHQGLHNIYSVLFDPCDVFIQKHITK